MEKFGLINLYNMQTKQTLASMFEANKQALENELKGLSLPKDSNKIQSIVTNYFDSLFDQDGSYRQSLTVSEDYILQAALSLLNAQQEMGQKLTEQEIIIETKTSSSLETDSEIKQTPIQKILSQKINGGKTLIGAGSGAILGKVALSSGWGAVFGAIAGTAIVLYLAAKSDRNPHGTTKAISPKPTVETSIQNTDIDITSFLNIIKQTCESIDSLINTFRSQIQKVVNKYESQDKPTLEREYGLLLESIQSLLGVAYSNTDYEKRLAKIDERLEQLVESLENYGLDVVKYKEENSLWFESLTSTKVLEPTMICPAIVKNGKKKKKGKVFVKE